MLSLVADGYGLVWVNPELITRIVRHGVGSTVYFDGISRVDAIDRCPGPLNVRDRPYDIARRVKKLGD